MTDRYGARSRARLLAMDAAERAFTAERPRLVGLAYRILGSRSDAEDVVQDAWIRFQRADPASIDRPEAWLTTVVSRLALDQLKSARHRRETYVGPWLPEPVRTPSDPLEDPSELATMSDTLTTGFLQVLESLGPVERVVFLLADVFRVPHDQIGTVVDRTPEATRQIASRARRKVRDGTTPRHDPDPEASRVVDELVTALIDGDLEAVVRLVADDAVLVSDGGAATHAARRPVVGVDRVARFLVNLVKRFVAHADAGLRLDRGHINAEPGLVVWFGDQPFVAATFTVHDGRVERLHLVRNPEKLAALAHHGELR
jgi:RNA polymerase sigma-70 factor, ECF subfamily